MKTALLTAALALTTSAALAATPPTDNWPPHADVIVDKPQAICDFVRMARGPGARGPFMDGAKTIALRFSSKYTLYCSQDGSMILTSSTTREVPEESWAK